MPPPLCCAVEISYDAFTTVWQTASTKILSGHDRGLKSLLNQTAHTLFQYVTHISRNKTPSVRHFESIISFNHKQNSKQGVSLNLIHLNLHSGWGHIYLDKK